jgi:hypothetical protein
VLVRRDEIIAGRKAATVRKVAKAGAERRWMKFISAGLSRSSRKFVTTASQETPFESYPISSNEAATSRTDLCFAGSASYLVSSLSRA